MRLSSPLVHLVSLIFSWNCLVVAQTSTATWYFPPGGLTVNYIDTVVFQWTSNFETAWLQLWCQNGDVSGNNVHLASTNQVSPSGNFSYILAGDDQDKETFPVACHALLAQADGSGVNSPDGGINFTSVANVKAQTFSLSASTSSSLTTSQSTAARSSTSSSSALTTTTSSSTSKSSTSSSSSAAASSPNPTSSSISNSTEPENPEPEDPNSTGHSSSGGKAKIGIGVAVVGIAVLGGCTWWLLRQRKKAAAGPQVVELPDNVDPAALRYQKFELEDEARRRHEMAANPIAHELGDDRKTIHELP